MASLFGDPVVNQPTASQPLFSDPTVSPSPVSVPGMEKLGGTPPLAGQRPVVNLQAPAPSMVGHTLNTVANSVGDSATAANAIFNDTSEGFGKGLAKSIYHGGDIVRRAAGAPRIINNPDVQAAMTPTSPAQAVGMGAEQAAEYLAPAGLEEATGKAMGAAGAKALAKVPGGASVAKVLGKSIANAAGAGAVAGVQTGGDPEAMRNAALAAGGTSAVLGAASEALPLKQAAAERMYGSALKPSPALPDAERKMIIQTGLREGLVLNADAVTNIQKRIDDINAQISQGIQDRSAAGATVDPEVVAGYTDRAAQRATQQVNPDADVAAVQSAKDEFLNNQSVDAPYTKIRPGTDEAAGTMVPEGEGTVSVPQPIPLADAQKLKTGTYTKLKGSYGEQSSMSREAQKDLARGLKDQIVQAFPEIANLNARESSLLALESSLQRFVGRTGNSELIGLGTPLTTLTAHAAGAPVVPAALVGAALKSTSVRSRLAIALARSAQKAAQNSGTGLASGAAGLADDLYGAVAPKPAQQPQQPSVIPPLAAAATANRRRTPMPAPGQTQ
jgi:hypothetical protein